MCGIAGILKLDGSTPQKEVLDQMNSALVHRGPDGSGVQIDGSIGLAHRRLSIIDLKTGDQPMSSGDGRLTIVFNGEIYNFKELRDELKKKGVRFHTSSDTEVILEAYRSWGVDAAQRFRGMFAFALWDRDVERLWLCRDRFGIKPLFYLEQSHQVVFGSEIKALLRVSNFDASIDKSAVSEYLQYGYIPAPKTIYRHVKALAPSHHVTFSPHHSGTTAPVRYWQVRFDPDNELTESQWLEKLYFCFKDSIRYHMISDVPIGAFLSGGVDSSAVCWEMSQQSNSIKTFTVGFDEEYFDERPFAAHVAASIGSQHMERQLSFGDIMQLTDELTWFYDQPFADSSAIPTYLISKTISKDVKVALSGDGGDEIFAGYDRYLSIDQHARSFLHLLFKPLRQAAFAPNVIRYYAANPLDRYYDIVGIFSRHQLRRLLRTSTDYRSALFDSFYRSSGSQDVLSQMQNADIHTYLPEDGLTKVDRASMAHSLEVRVPMLDHILVEAVVRAPHGLRLKGGQSKYLLKTMMRGRLPDFILDRRKRGFSIPLAKWLREQPLLLSLIQQNIEHSPLVCEFCRPEPVAELFAQHRSGQTNHASRIWALYFLSRWAARFVDGPTAS